jgi:hypothetical protein
MDALYDWLFWYNDFEKLWYAINRAEYNRFFDGMHRNETTYYTSSDVNELIQIIKDETTN